MAIPGSTIRELKRQARDDAKAAALREKAAKLRLKSSKLEAKAARYKAKAQMYEGRAGRLSKRPIQLSAIPPRAPLSEQEASFPQKEKQKTESLGSSSKPH